MAPQSVAILGASNNPAKMGTLQCLNIAFGGFSGQVVPVHPTEDTVLGKKAVKHILDLPFAPDLGMLVVPSPLVPDMVDDFGKLGTRHMIIITAGFKETGPGGKALEAKLLDIAAKHGIRFLGPNCIGVLNTHLPFNATVVPWTDPPGFLSIASQSGTYIAQSPAFLKRTGVRFSKAISVGNEASIDIVDCLEYLGEDPETKAIGLYIESIRRADRFLETARRVGREKPIVAQYVGGTQLGARSGTSHTGALASPDYVYDGLFAQAGIIRVQTIEEVYRVGNALALQPPLSGNRVAVLTNSGGPGTAMADVCDRMGVAMPEFSPELQKKLKANLPPHASPKNPVDLTFHMGIELMTKTLPELMLESGEIDGLLVHGIMDTGWGELIWPVFNKAFGMSREALRATMLLDVNPLLRLAEKHGKPLCLSSFMDERLDNATVEFHKAGIPVFDSPEKAAYAMGCFYRHLLIRQRVLDPPAPLGPAPEAARSLVAAAGADPMDEHAAKEILRAYGVPVCREVLAHGLEEALKAARETGYPVAVKACSKDILHKTERGLVHLGIKDAGGVKAAVDAITKEAGEVPLLVCEMVKFDREFLAGMARFPGFPPCVLFGLGGVQAEALRDTALRVAPLSLGDARELALSLCSKDLLGAWRGMPAADLDALARVLAAVGNIALHFPQIREMDLNPIALSGGKPVVLDALFVME